MERSVGRSWFTESLKLLRSVVGRRVVGDRSCGLELKSEPRHELFTCRIWFAVRHVRSFIPCLRAEAQGPSVVAGKVLGESYDNNPANWPPLKLASSRLKVSGVPV